MNRMHCKWLAAVLLLVGAQQAFAQDSGTAAGTEIENIATVDYEVGGVAQSQEVNDPEAVFLVDRLINVTVAELGGANTSVVPDASDQAVTFTVTNNTNDVMDFALAASNDDDSPPPGGGTDSFDIDDTFSYYLDSGPDDGGGEVPDVFDPTDTLITHIDELAADDSVTIHVIADIPDATVVSDGDIAGVSLAVTAYESDGAATIGATAAAEDDADADDPEEVQNVFGDAAGTAAGDIARDGVHSAVDAYEVASATIVVTKTSFVISDPFNDETNPKAIPGAEILYCVEVANTGGTDATDVTVSDPIPANTTYIAESIEIFNGTASIACDGDDVGTGTAVTDTDADADGGDSGPDGDGTEVTTTVATLPDTDGVTTTIFRVTVD